MTGRPDRWFVIAEIACTVVLPTVVLLGMSSPEQLGPVPSLVIALAFPAVWAIVTQVRERRVSGLAMIALLSIAATGGIGLAAVDTRWFAVKEAIIPGALGLLVLATAPTRLALVPVLLERILDPERTRQVLVERGTEGQFHAVARRATVVMGFVSIGSAVASFVLAQAMVHSAAGTEAFANELGRYTVLSFVAINLPMLVGAVFILRRVLSSLEDVAGTTLEELMR